MNSGLPRHLNVTDLPSGMSASLISILARAKTSAAAAMDDTKCVTRDLAAYAPATPPAGNCKDEMLENWMVWWLRKKGLWSILWVFCWLLFQLKWLYVSGNSLFKVSINNLFITALIDFFLFPNQVGPTVTGFSVRKVPEALRILRDIHEKHILRIRAYHRYSRWSM